MRLRFRLFALLLLAVAPSTTLAWSQLGHRLVASLAATRLTPAAAGQVAQLLAGEPDPTLAGIASWADELRNTDPARFKATSAWHYIDSKDGSCRFVLPRDCPDGNCVVGAIESQRKALADRTQPPAVRRDALRFLVHLVADAHQPLHASNRRDSGGNRFDIHLRTDIAAESRAGVRNSANDVTDTNLHAVWDYYLLASARLPLERYLSRLQPRLPAAVPASQAPIAWAEESCNLIDSLQLYPARHSLDHAYLSEMRPLAERRLEIAAVRLAALLNEVLR